jgi:hypothetical protein
MSLHCCTDVVVQPTALSRMTPQSFTHGHTWSMGIWGSQPIFGDSTYFMCTNRPTWKIGFWNLGPFSIKCRKLNTNMTTVSKLYLNWIQMVQYFQSGFNDVSWNITENLMEYPWKKHYNLAIVPNHWFCGTSKILAKSSKTSSILIFYFNQIWPKIKKHNFEQSFLLHVMFELLYWSPNLQMWFHAPALGRFRPTGVEHGFVSVNFWV